MHRTASLPTKVKHSIFDDLISTVSLVPKTALARVELLLVTGLMRNNLHED